MSEVKTFREAYAVLQGHAETLRRQTEPNIDDLLSIVTESVDAYKICKARIDAVEKALEQALTEVDADEASPVSPAGKANGQSGSGAGVRRNAPPQRDATLEDDSDRDIPF